MLFNSLAYLLFLPTVVGIYYLLPHRFRWILLLTASHAFYAAWRIEYLLLIQLSTSVDYFAAIEMAKTQDRSRRKLLLALSLFVNLGLLFTFKYLDFAFDSINQLIAPLQWGELPIMDLLLPVGISFYTFQTLSYTIDVYQGRIKPERHFGIFAVYVSFFPQLVAGPIERAGRLIPQFWTKKRLKYATIVQGLRRILIGLFKKVVVADLLARYVDLVYGQPEAFGGTTVALATIFFTFQIYCDFSGYTDIAIGSAQLMGINLRENFNAPYLARNLGDFWRRWHMSLSTWFRDYVYFPLGGNRGAVAIMTVFLLSGLWHGANWTFVVWGGLHGGLLMLETWTGGFRKRMTKRYGEWWQWPITFILVCLLWLVFRAESMEHAWVLLNQMAHGGGWTFSELDVFGTGLDFLLCCVFVLGLAIFEILSHNKPVSRRLDELPAGFRWALYYLMLFTLLIMGLNAQTPFLYFQF